MSENNTMDPTSIPKFEKTVSVKTALLEGKEVFIKGYNITRGKPTQYTRPDQIGDDGLTDYCTVQTTKSFNLPPKKGEPEEPINSFFVTSIIIDQVKRAETYFKTNVSEESSLGPVKLIKRVNKKEGKPDYWCLAFKDDDDYN